MHMHSARYLGHFKMHQSNLNYINLNKAVKLIEKKEQMNYGLPKTA